MSKRTIFCFLAIILVCQALPARAAETSSLRAPVVTGYIDRYHTQKAGASLAAPTDLFFQAEVEHKSMVSPSILTWHVLRDGALVTKLTKTSQAFAPGTTAKYTYHIPAARLGKATYTVRFTHSLLDDPKQTASGETSFSVKSATELVAIYVTNDPEGTKHEESLSGVKPIHLGLAFTSDNPANHNISIREQLIEAETKKKVFDSSLYQPKPGTLDHRRLADTTKLKPNISILYRVDLAADKGRSFTGTARFIIRRASLFLDAPLSLTAKSTGQLIIRPPAELEGPHRISVKSTGLINIKHKPSELETDITAPFVTEPKVETITVTVTGKSGQVMTASRTVKVLPGDPAITDDGVDPVEGNILVVRKGKKIIPISKQESLPSFLLDKMDFRVVTTIDKIDKAGHAAEQAVSMSDRGMGMARKVGAKLDLRDIANLSNPISGVLTITGIVKEYSDERRAKAKNSTILDADLKDIHFMLGQQRALFVKESLFGPLDASVRTKLAAVDTEFDALRKPGNAEMLGGFDDEEFMVWMNAIAGLIRESYKKKFDDDLTGQSDYMNAFVKRLDQKDWFNK